MTLPLKARWRNPHSGKVMTLVFNRILPTINDLLRMHWAKRQREITNMQGAILLQARNQEWPKPLGKIKVDIAIIRTHKLGRKMDAVNLRGAVDKLVLDNLVMLRYLPDDSDKYVEWGKVEHLVGDSTRTEISITLLA